MLTESDKSVCRAKLLRQKGAVVWMTGLPGSGKSTLASALEDQLLEDGHLTYVLDGDLVRKHLCADLTFSPADREENIRRIGEVAALIANAGLIAIIAFVSPYRASRSRARQASSGMFFEVFVDAPLSVCEQRDPKGMYKKAREGLIPDFTGIGAPYEAPEHADLVLKTAETSVEHCTGQLIDLLREQGALTT